MKNQKLILAVIISSIAATATAYAVTNSNQQEAKSIAWYTANVKEARQQNKTCYDNAELQSTKNCKNALHALELVYVGVGN